MYASFEVTMLIVAPFVGSFLGLLIQRIPRNNTLVFSRSRCDACKHLLHSVELIPIISWLIQGGRCRHCGTTIPLLCPLSELSAFLIAVCSVLMTSGSVLLFTCLFGWLLFAIAVIDLRHFIIPDKLTYPLAFAGLCAATLLENGIPIKQLLGLVAGYLSFLTIAFAYERLRGRVGLGHGDIKLFAAVGAWVGIAALPSVALLAAIFALITFGLRTGRSNALTRFSKIAFGPFLAAAAWVIWLFGPISLATWEHQPS